MSSNKKKVPAKKIRLQQRGKEKTDLEILAEQVKQAKEQPVEQAPPQKVRRKDRGKEVKRGDLILPFEKLILFMLVIFLFAVPFAFMNVFQPMIYVGIIDLLLLGIVFSFKPDMVIQVMRKKDPAKFERNYAQKIKVLAISLRLYGVGFFIIGAGMLRLLILK